MEPTENNFEAALYSLATLTALQPQLTGASRLIEATKKLIEEKITTLAFTPRDLRSYRVKYLLSLATIRGELQKSNIDPGQIDTIIDEQLRGLQNRLEHTSWADMAKYRALQETRGILASEAVRFGFQKLDNIIVRVAGGLYREAVEANKALRSPGKEIAKEIANTPPRPAKSVGEADKETEASMQEEMSDVAPAPGSEVTEGSSGDMEFAHGDTPSPVGPRQVSESLSSPHENLHGSLG